MGNFYTCAGLRYSLCAVNVPLVLRKAKAVAPASHAYHLAHGLQLALNSSGHSDLAALYADAIAGGAAWEAILAQLTIGEIYFSETERSSTPSGSTSSQRSWRAGQASKVYESGVPAAPPVKNPTRSR